MATHLKVPLWSSTRSAPDGLQARDHRSFWEQEALHRETESEYLSPLRGQGACDALIVGGGFTGLWTALELSRRAPSADIRLIEADVCGAGASGSNAGFLMNLWPKFPSLLGLTSTDEAIWIGREAERAVEEILEFVVSRDSDVGLNRSGWLWVASNPAQRDAWDDIVSALENAGVFAFEVATDEQTRKLVGTETHFGGAIDSTCASLQPGLLVRELRDAVLEAGVQIYEHTPLTALQEGQQVTALTPSGQLQAQRVVLAINAWAASFEEIGRHMVMIASDTLVTEPVPEIINELGWNTGITVSDSRRRLNYYRTTADKRIVFGKGGIAVGYGSRAASTMWGRPNTSLLRAQMTRTFPRLNKVAIADSWRAPVEYSVNSLPFCGWLKTIRNVCYATGYSGDGVGPSKMVARILASMVLNYDDDYTRSVLARPPNRKLPPEPFRFVGAQPVLWAVKRTEDAEDRGEIAPRWLRMLADVDPTTFVG